MPEPPHLAPLKVWRCRFTLGCELIQRRSRGNEANRTTSSAKSRSPNRSPSTPRLHLGTRSNVVSTSTKHTWTGSANSNGPCLGCSAGPQFHVQEENHIGPHRPGLTMDGGSSLAPQGSALCWRVREPGKNPHRWGFHTKKPPAP